MQTHRQIAKRKTILWQAAAVVILAAAGAAIALPAVSNFFAPPAPPKPADHAAAPPPSRPDYSALDFQRAQRGASAVATQVVAVIPVVNPIVEDDAKVAPPPPLSSEWAYIGSIITPANRHALVKVNGQQQIYSIGSSHNDAKLVTIEPDHIEVESGGVKKTIRLAERTLLAHSEGPRHPVAFRPTPNMGMNPGAPGSPMVMNAMNRAMPNPNQNPGTMEQARAAAMAAAEAARRSQIATDVPGIIPLEKIDAEDLQTAAKYLSDPGLDDDSRLKYLSSLGISPGTPVDQALTRAKQSGVDLGGEAGKHVINAIESNAKNRGAR